MAVSFPDLGVDTGLAVAAMNAVMSVPIGVTAETEAGAVEGGRSELQGATGTGYGAVDATMSRPALNVWQVQCFCVLKGLAVWLTVFL